MSTEFPTGDSLRTISANSSYTLWHTTIKLYWFAAFHAWLVACKITATSDFQLDNSWSTQLLKAETVLSGLSGQPHFFSEKP